MDLTHIISTNRLFFHIWVILISVFNWTYHAPNKVKYISAHHDISGGLLDLPHPGMEQRYGRILGETLL